MSEIERPKRDVSARSAIGSCSHCGGNAHSLIGGEHIWKCSEVVPVAAIESLADELEYEYEAKAGSAGEVEAAKAYEHCVEELRKLCRSRQDSGRADYLAETDGVEK